MAAQFRSRLKKMKPPLVGGKLRGGKKRGLVLGGQEEVRLKKAEQEEGWKEPNGLEKRARGGKKATRR